MLCFNAVYLEAPVLALAAALDLSLEGAVEGIAAATDRKQRWKHAGEEAGTAAIGPLDGHGALTLISNLWPARRQCGPCCECMWLTAACASLNCPML